MRTRVVSWNEAAEMNLSVDSETLVMPREAGARRRFASSTLEFLRAKVVGSQN